MKSGLDQLANYAAYHRDRRNIATHLIGVPMIVFAVESCWQDLRSRSTACN